MVMFTQLLLTPTWQMDVGGNNHFEALGALHTAGCNQKF
jgi:hypothetical protein